MCKNVCYLKGYEFEFLLELLVLGVEVEKIGGLFGFVDNLVLKNLVSFFERFCF